MTINANELGANVSVVVPSYNHAHFVGSCLRSIVKQSQQPRELLVIDDGSTDDSPKQIAAILNDCPFPSELIVRDNRGLCATLNQGLEKTSGEYFAYLSSDDLWLAEFLQARTELLDQRPEAVLCYGHAFFVDDENNIVDCTADWANYVDGDVRSMLLTTIAPMSPTVLYRRSALEKFGWNEESKLEDYELYLKLSSAGEFAFDSRVLSAWRWHKSNTSWNQRMMLEEHLNALHRLAPQLGLSADEVGKLQRRIRFERAEDFLRLGDKETAKTLIVENFDATSPAILARLAARMLLPHRVLQLRAQRKKRRKNRRRGKIEV